MFKKNYEIQNLQIEKNHPFLNLAKLLNRSVSKQRIEKTSSCHHMQEKKKEISFKKDL